MRVDAFDFDLPEDLIALRPARPRDAARLLEVRHGTFRHHVVRDLPNLLAAGDLLVFNDTRVLSAALRGERARLGGAPPGVEALRPKIDILLHMRVGPDAWRAFARPARKLDIGDRLSFAGCLSAEVHAKGEEGEILLVFDRTGLALDEAVEASGEMPLPPYIARRRPSDAEDLTDYQTIFANERGSVAAPTAGLHFTPALLAALKEKGVESARLTLHVGAGTFLPVKAEDTSGHKMHAERGEISEAAAEAMTRARREGRRVIAIGTTSLRLIESAATDRGDVLPFSGETSIFITPGFRFRAVDLLWTNFHLPRSTLFMLVSAFAGTEVMRRAYETAIAERYRFYSYGDASLLHRAGA